MTPYSISKEKGIVPEKMWKKASQCIYINRVKIVIVIVNATVIKT